MDSEVRFVDIWWVSCALRCQNETTYCYLMDTEVVGDAQFINWESTNYHALKIAYDDCEGIIRRIMLKRGQVSEYQIQQAVIAFYKSLVYKPADQIYDSNHALTHSRVDSFIGRLAREVHASDQVGS